MMLPLLEFFIKGLQNAHSLATHNYENGPQTPIDAISEVEKLNAAQQLMAMIIPPPKLMWCQTKKIAVSGVKNQDILHDIALTLGTMSVMNMVTLSWNAHTEYLLQELQQHITNHTGVAMPDQVQGTTVKTETDEANQDHSPIFVDITAQVITIHIEATLGHNTEIDATTTGAVHDDLAQFTEDTATDITMTLHTGHITDPPTFKDLQVMNLRIAVDHIHDHPIDPQDMDLADQIHIPARQEKDCILRRTWRWRLKIHTLIITALMITPVTQERNQIL